VRPSPRQRSAASMPRRSSGRARGRDASRAQVFRPSSRSRCEPRSGEGGVADFPRWLASSRRTLLCRELGPTCGGLSESLALRPGTSVSQWACESPTTLTTTLRQATPQHRAMPRLPTARHTAPHSTAPHSAAQHRTAPHSTAQHSTAQYNTTQHNTTQHDTTRHDTTQHDTTQHN